MDYITIFFFSLILSLVLTPIVRKAMLKFGILDMPSESRWHRQPVALMGGIAIFISFALVALLRVELKREILVILLGGGIIFALGFLDDLFGTRPKVKFAIQVLVAFGVAYFGVASKILPYSWLNILLTVFWIVGLINALNLLDNMDGLSSGITIIAVLAILGLSLQKGETYAALLSLALAGSCLGFLRYNFNPAKIFMGDCGSMFLGYMLATLAVLGGWQRSSPFVGTFLAPILILSVAIFDTTLVTILRLRHGKMPWQGGRDHSSHRLVSIFGGSEKGAMLVLYGIAIIAGVIGSLVIPRLSSLTAILFTATFGIALIIFGIRLAKVKVRGVRNSDFFNSEFRRGAIACAGLPRPNSEFRRGEYMNVLITGGAGFIGSYLTEAHLSRGDNVSVIDNLSTGKLNNIDHLQENPSFSLTIDSILNEAVMEKLISECDLVYHLAAAVGVRYVIENPLESIKINIRGTEIVLEQANKYKKKVFLSSTSEIYGKSDDIPFKEDADRLLGSTHIARWSYSATKAVDEFLALAYWREKQLPVIIVRFFNICGPRQTGQYGMVIPRFVKKALLNQPILVYDDGSQSRCFTYIGDVVEAILALIDCPDAAGEIFNIGSTEEITIQELAEKIIELTNSKSTILHIPYEEAYEKGFEDMKRRVPDIEKINNLIGWQPKVGIDELLTKIIEYHRGAI